MKNILLCIFGILVMNGVPGLAMYLLSKKDTWLKKQKYTILYFMGITNGIICAWIMKNWELLMGIFIGSSIFHLLIEEGIQQIKIGKNTLNKGSNTIKYSIFSSVVLLFVSGDYLLTNKTNGNIISRVDGVVLLAIYLIFVVSKLQVAWRTKRENESSFAETIHSFSGEKIIVFKRVVFIIILEIITGISAYAAISRAAAIGIKYGFSQYVVGAGLLGWMLQIAPIVLLLNEKDPEEKSNSRIHEVLITITVIMGILAILQPISISLKIIMDIVIFVILEIGLYEIRRVDSKIASSLMATAYVMYVLYVILG